MAAQERAKGRERARETLPNRVVGWVGRHHRPLIVLAVVVVVILSLYGPVQRYYVAWRTRGDQQAKADAIDADNDALKQDIDRLTTRDGIEDEARQRGYAYPSEGTSDSSNATSNTGNGNKGSDATDSVFSYADIEQPWFIHVLDFIFVYNGPTD